MSEVAKSHSTSGRIIRTVIGSVVILFSIVMLVDLLANFINVSALLMWWPLGFVLAGLVMVSSDKSNPLLGASLLLAGVVVLLGRIGLLTDEVRYIVEVIALLFIGIAIATPYKSSKS